MRPQTHPADGESPEEGQAKAEGWVGGAQPEGEARGWGGGGGRGTAARLERLRREGDPDLGTPQPERGRAKTRQM